MKRLFSLIWILLLAGLCAPALGQASLVISQINQLRDYKVVDSYTALQSVPPVATGVRVYVQGMTGVGDGAEGFWYWAQGDRTAADGATVLASTVSGADGRWKRIFTTGVYRASWFGCKGDGTTDNLTLLPNAITTACGEGATEFIIPHGTYFCSAAMIVNFVSHIRIVGEGNPILRAPLNSDDKILVIQGSVDVSVENITFDGNHPTITDVNEFGQYGLVFEWAGAGVHNLSTQNRVLHCTFENIGDTALYDRTRVFNGGDEPIPDDTKNNETLVDGCYFINCKACYNGQGVTGRYIVLTNNHIWNCYAGFKMDGQNFTDFNGNLVSYPTPSGGFICSHNTFRDCGGVIGNGQGLGMVIIEEYTSDCIITDNVFDRLAYTVAVQVGTGQTNKNARHVVISHNTFSNITQNNAINLRAQQNAGPAANGQDPNTTGADVSDIVIDHNIIHDIEGAGIFIRNDTFTGVANWLAGIRIENNTFQDWGTLGDGTFSPDDAINVFSGAGSPNISDVTISGNYFKRTVAVGNPHNPYAINVNLTTAFTTTTWIITNNRFEGLTNADNLIHLYECPFQMTGNLMDQGTIQLNGCTGNLDNNVMTGVSIKALWDGTTPCAITADHNIVTKGATGDPYWARVYNGSTWTDWRTVFTGWTQATAYSISAGTFTHNTHVKGWTFAPNEDLEAVRINQGSGFGSDLLHIVDSAGGDLFRETSLGILDIYRPGASVALIQTFTQGDTSPTWKLFTSGQMQWGPGGNTPPDTTLTRAAAGVLQTPGNFNSQGGLTSVPTSDVVPLKIGEFSGQTNNLITVQDSTPTNLLTYGPSGIMALSRSGFGVNILNLFKQGDANPGFKLNNDGQMNWGAGGASATDTTLQRTGVGFLKVTNNLQLGGGFQPNLVTKTGAYTTLSTDFTILCDATSAAFTVTLGAASSHTGQILVIKKIDSSANAVTVARTGSDTIDGASTVSLSAQYKYLRVVSDGAGHWYITGSN